MEPPFQITTKSDIWSYGVFLYDLMFPSAVWKSEIVAQGNEKSSSNNNGQKVIQCTQLAYAGIANCRAEIPFIVSRRVKKVTDEEVKKALGNDWNRDMIVKIANGTKNGIELNEKNKQLLKGFVEREQRFVKIADQKYDEMESRRKLTLGLKKLTTIKSALEAHSMASSINYCLILFLNYSQNTM